MRPVIRMHAKVLSVCIIRACRLTATCAAGPKLHGRGGARPVPLPAPPITRHQGQYRRASLHCPRQRPVATYRRTALARMDSVFALWNVGPACREVMFICHLCRLAAGRWRWTWPPPCCRPCRSLLPWPWATARTRCGLGRPTAACHRLSTCPSQQTVFGAVVQAATRRS